RSKPTTPAEQASGGPNKPQQPAPQDEVVVELSDAQAEAEEGNLEGRCSVKYRFTKGAPRPDKWYMCTTDTGSGMGIPLQVKGDALRNEGTITGPVGFIAPERVKDTWPITLQESPGEGGPYRKISNEAQVTFRRIPVEVISLAAEQLLKEYEADRAGTSKKYQANPLAATWA